MDEHENEEARLHGLFIGTVVENRDPKKLGRVRVRIPGVIEPSSNWAYPLGASGGGAPQSGAYDPPRINATVGILFNQGDPDHPWYMPANWGITDAGSEVPTPIKDDSVSADDAPELKAWETKQWLVTVDDRVGHQLFQFKHKFSGDTVTIDGDAPGIFIHGSAAVIIQSDGLIKLEGLTVQINDRVILPGTKPI